MRLVAYITNFTGDFLVITNEYNCKHILRFGQRSFVQKREYEIINTIIYTRKAYVTTTVEQAI